MPNNRILLDAGSENGDIYVADGYGSGHIFRYDADGRFIQKFGAEDGPLESHLHQPHGVTIDLRAGVAKATLLVTSRLDQCFRHFTLDGKYLGTIATPGVYVCRPAITGDRLYTGVCWSQRRDVAIPGDAEGRVLSRPAANRRFTTAIRSNACAAWRRRRSTTATTSMFWRTTTSS